MMIKYLKSGATVCLFLLMVVFLHSQTLEFGIGTGISGYDGDFLSNRSQVFKTVSAAGQIQLSLYFNERWRGQIFYNHGKVAASDVEITGNARNLSFATVIDEVGFRILFHLIPFDPYAGSGRRFTAYGGTGFTVFHFNPFTKNFQGQKTFLRDLGTAGQFLDSNNSSSGPYSLYQMGIPATVGIAWAANNRLILGLELDFRFLFTDYLDDLGRDKFPSFSGLLTMNEEAALLTHRGWELQLDDTGGSRPVDIASRYYDLESVESKFRSTGKYNDAFGFLMFKVSYLLEDLSFRKNRKFGCYSF